MNKDIGTAVVLSLAAHGSLLWFGSASHSPGAIVRGLKPVEPAVVMPVIPPEDPPEEVPSEERTELKTTPDLAPPRLPDPPVARTEDAFVQPIEFPHEGPPINSNMIRIPELVGPHSGDPNTSVFDPSQLDVPPEATFRAVPVYPYALKREGLGGEVVVDFIVDASGRVQHAFVIRSSRPGFDEAAVTGVMKWRFKPGKKAGRAVATHMQVPIDFKLDPGT